MKKSMLLLAISLMLLLNVPAMAQTQEFLQGPVTEVSADGWFLMADETYGDVRVNYDETTVFDGLAVPRVGQYVSVGYSGILTRSLPPQALAESVTLYLLDGMVLAYDAQTHAALVASADFGEVLVYLPGETQAFAAGDFVTVQYNGLMLLSYPAKINAYGAYRLESLQGVITAADGGWMLIADGGDDVRVNFDGNTRVYGQLFEGKTVVVYYNGVMTMSLPPQIYGEVLLVFE